MHGLETIIRINAEAVGTSIRRARAAGLTVVEVRRGLAVETFTAHKDPVEAERRAEAIRRVERDTAVVNVLPPLSDAEAALVRGRDQSEDRQGRLF